MTPNPRDGTGRFHSGLAPLFRGRGYLWRKFEGWTLAAGVIIVAAIVLMKLNQLEPVATQPGESLIGTASASATHHLFRMDIYVCVGALQTN